jgi:hypothetical protein
VTADGPWPSLRAALFWHMAVAVVIERLIAKLKGADEGKLGTLFRKNPGCRKKCPL